MIIIFALMIYENCSILLNFEYRVKGDHFIYYRNDIPEIINIQPRGNKAKGYEVKQIRLLFKQYGI